MVWIDGHDIRDYAIPSLRRAFSIVSQDSVLLSETLRFNLLFGLDREVSPSELDAVIEEARLQDVVSMLPGGLDGDLGERGARLSGGQKQRVAIARALLRRSSFLILDEATSGLDAITEKLVQEAIGNALRHSTALIIAHRFTTIQLAGHVVVLNEGRVVQQGPLADIASSDGLFREMSEKQVFADLGCHSDLQPVASSPGNNSGAGRHARLRRSYVRDHLHRRRIAGCHPIDP
jgi:ABC-type multidrug transport system fused ATPase/permease subunit